MKAKLLKLILVGLGTWTLTGAAVALADGSGGGRNQRVSEQQRLIAMDYFNRSQKMRMYDQMLAEAGYQAADPAVVFTSEYCQQRICTENLEVRRAYTGPGAAVSLSFGVGIWEDFRHSFVWDLDVENHRALLPVYISQHIFHQMGGDDIAGGLIFHFRDHLPDYLADSADHNSDIYHISLRRVTCTGPRDVQGMAAASCVALTLDGDEVVIGSARAARIYEVLHTPGMTSSGVHFGRDVQVLDANRLQISLSFINCEYSDPDSARPPGGSCDFFPLKNP